MGRVHSISYSIRLPYAGFMFLKKVHLSEFITGNMLPMTQCYEKMSFIPFLSKDGIEHQSTFENLLAGYLCRHTLHY